TVGAKGANLMPRKAAIADRMRPGAAQASKPIAGMCCRREEDLPGEHSMRVDRVRVGFYAHAGTDTARTRPTKHGPLGCRGKSRGGSALLPARCRLRAAERSVLCPKCPRCVRSSMSVETGHVGQSLRSNTLTQFAGGGTRRGRNSATALAVS